MTNFIVRKAERVAPNTVEENGARFGSALCWTPASAPLRAVCLDYGRSLSRFPKPRWSIHTAWRSPASGYCLSLCSPGTEIAAWNGLLWATLSSSSFSVSWATLAKTCCVNSLSGLPLPHIQAESLRDDEEPSTCVCRASPVSETSGSPTRC